MKRRGVTLMELLVAAFMAMIVTFGAVQAYSNAAQYQLRVLPARESFEAREEFERRLRMLLERAFVDESGRTYFIIGVPGGGSTGTSSPDEANSLTFTIRGEPAPGAALSSTDDFETQHTEFGPLGGMAEVSISTEPYVPSDEIDGLFIREQKPSDGDPTQGGFESLFADQVASMTFEAYDGLEWTTVWDTTTSDGRLPAAIRVTYRWEDDPEDATSVLIIRLPLSDVTIDDPFAAGERP